jgi:hypothetical protein
MVESVPKYHWREQDLSCGDTFVLWRGLPTREPNLGLPGPESSGPRWRELGGRPRYRNAFVRSATDVEMGILGSPL